MFLSSTTGRPDVGESAKILQLEQSLLRKDNALHFDATQAYGAFRRREKLGHLAGFPFLEHPFVLFLYCCGRPMRFCRDPLLSRIMHSIDVPFWCLFSASKRTIVSFLER